jgi:hypothetical protein
LPIVSYAKGTILSILNSYFSARSRKKYVLKKFRSKAAVHIGYLNIIVLNHGDDPIKEMGDTLISTTELFLSE